MAAALFAPLASLVAVPLSQFESLYQLAQIEAIAQDPDAVVFRVTGERQPTIRDLALDDYLVISPAQVRDLRKDDLVLVRYPGVEAPVLRRVVKASLTQAVTRSDRSKFGAPYIVRDNTLLGVVTARIENDVDAEKLVDHLPLYTEEELAALDEGDRELLEKSIGELAQL